MMHAFPVRTMRKLVLFGIALSLAGTAAAAPLPKPPSFAMCAVCHKVGKDEKSPLGPSLWGVGGRKSGTVPGFAYSAAMKGANIVWDRPRLIAFVTDPRKTVPGNRMAFTGQKDPKAAAAIADFLLSLK